MDDYKLDGITRQLEVIIRLLARIAFGPEVIREIVTKGKRDSARYVDGYNACDGTRGVTEIAKVIGITHGTLSPILQSWAEIGIVSEVSKPGGTFYKKVATI